MKCKTRRSYPDTMMQPASQADGSSGTCLDAISLDENAVLPSTGCLQLLLLSEDPPLQFSTESLPFNLLPA